MPRNPHQIASVRVPVCLLSTSSWLELWSDASMRAEDFNFSDGAHMGFGNDVATIVSLDPGAVSMLLNKLREEDSSMPEVLTEEDDLACLCAHFRIFSGLGKFCRTHDIPLTKSFDPYA
ncbi:MAG: hypothetical protein ACO3KY_10665 [Lysobacterales bacterium]